MPCGIPWQDRAKTEINRHLPATANGGPCIFKGTIGRKLVLSPEGCMPDSTNFYVETDRGTRLLQLDELAKAKGIPSEWRNKQVKLPRKAVTTGTCLHILTAACDSVSSWLRDPAKGADENDYEEPPPFSQPQHEEATSEEAYEWVYDYPNLEPGSDWYNARVRKLHQESQRLPDPAAAIAAGLEALEIHRGNYTPEGPKILQLLWWEFPPEHQDAVRLGSTMRFLVDPGSTYETEKSRFTPEQLAVVEEFVEELISLGVLKPAMTPLRKICPLFVVPKPGQPGQWRCIADMRRGGQNECCGGDPIYLPSSCDILPHLYHGGWTAIADMNKYFHNFLTLPEERDLMGVVHPITGKLYHYVTLPMGSTNSPAIACRIGEGVLEAFRQESKLLHGVKVIENTWHQGLLNGSYESKLGHGRVELQANGRPVSLVMGFVDDFFLHSQSQQECHEVLSEFMDMTVRLGFICQKVKTSPPQQIQKYCGMLYDTTKTPTLRIPPNKVSRCLASAHYLLSKPRSQRLSRLSLAVVTGVLQSVVEATPQHVGQTHLRHLYDELHELEGVGHLTGRDKYYTTVQLGSKARRALQWWVQFLERNPGATNCREHTDGLTLKWGDGSGTGTGGTTEFYPLDPQTPISPHMELWMGVWRAQSRPMSSNWKELRTILRSLEHEKAQNRVRHHTVFYFTDNLVSYYVIGGGSSRSPHLQLLVEEIKELEETLGCHLEVVHVPATAMILQGTDSLSRGLWLAPERRPYGINQHIFLPIPFTTQLGNWACRLLGWPCQYTKLTISLPGIPPVFAIRLRCGVRRRNGPVKPCQSSFGPGSKPLPTPRLSSSFLGFCKSAGAVCAAMLKNWACFMASFCPIVANMMLTCPLFFSMSPATFLLWVNLGWGDLPLVCKTTGTSVKPNLCAGCHKGFSARHPASLQCAFRERGFQFLTGESVIPCGVQYHAECFKASGPFQTRLAKGRGLVAPIKTPGFFPNFICEACNVRSALDRELEREADDVVLLMLERMRQLDTMHQWAHGTLKHYRSHYKRIRAFERRFGVIGLRSHYLIRPPQSEAMVLMWNQLLYSIRAGKEPGTSIAFNTSRQARSAASFFYQWDLQVSHPGQAFRDPQRRTLLVNRLSPTDELAYTIQNGGMARRMGTSTRPSWALQHVHIKYILDHLTKAHSEALDPDSQHELATAILATLILWKGWLRGGETFSLESESMTAVRPEQGPEYGLPEGLGFVEARLLAETKSSPHRTADVLMAYTSASGLSVRRWLEEVMKAPPHRNGRLFSSRQRAKWDSRYYRSKYLWPILELQRMGGEPTLKAFTDVEGQRIQDAVYSCHSFRRGAETFVRKVHHGLTARGATLDEIYEHARWRKRGSRASEAMDIHYTELPLLDRLAITFLCM